MKKAVLLTLIVIFSGLTLSYAGSIDGSWKGKVSTPNGDMNLTFVFKVLGDSLTGSVTSEMGELPLNNGKIKGDSLSFSLDLGGNVISQEGKILGDTIKITAKEFPGEILLTRAVTESKIDGTWQTKVEGPNGAMDLTFTFKVDGNALTGTDKSDFGEIPIVNGKVNGDEFSFDIEFDGNKITHQCKLVDKDTINAKVNAFQQENEMVLKRVNGK